MLIALATTMLQRAALCAVTFFACSCKDDPPQVTRPLSLAPETLPSAEAGVAYEAELQLEGDARPPVNWSLLGGARGGLELVEVDDRHARLAGVPVEGEHSLRILAVDIAGQVADRTYRLLVTPGRLTIRTETLPAGVVGAPYEATIEADVDASVAVEWALESGYLHSGLEFTAVDGRTARITGTPYAVGVRQVVIAATDHRGLRAARTFNLEVMPAPPPLRVVEGSLPVGHVGVEYEARLAAQDGAPPYRWSLADGVLPSGLQLTEDGLITGRPTDVTSYQIVSVEVTDQAGAHDQSRMGITVRPAPEILPESITDRWIGVESWVNLSCEHCAELGVLTWSVVAGALPAGMALRPNPVDPERRALVIGTPTQLGSSTFTVEVVDEQGLSGRREYTVEVGPWPIEVQTVALPATEPGRAYAASITTRGGYGPLTWALVGGSLPPGITLETSSTAVARLSGVTHSTEPRFDFTVRISDGLGTSAEQTLSILVREFTQELVVWGGKDGTAAAVAQVSDVGGAVPTPPMRMSQANTATSPLASSVAAQSPSGERLALFDVDLADATVEVFLTELHGASPTVGVQVGAPLAGRAVSGHYWSPDSTRLAFVVGEGFDLTLYAVDLSAPPPWTVHEIARVPTSYAPVAWTASGDHLVFAGEDDASIAVVRWSGPVPGAPVAIGTTSGPHVRFRVVSSPERVLYMGAGSSDPSTRHLYGVDLSRAVPAAPVQVSDTTAPGDSVLSLFEVAPDGSQLAYQATQGGQPGLYLVDVAGGESRLAVTGTVATMLWSPTSSHLAVARYLTPSSPLQELLLVDVTNGGAPVLLDAGPTIIRNLRFSPDGSALLFESYSASVSRVARTASPAVVYTIPISGGHSDEIAFAPDSSAVVLVQYVNATYGRPYLVDLRVDPPITTNIGARAAAAQQVHDVRWLADSTRIVVITGPEEVHTLDTRAATLAPERVGGPSSSGARTVLFVP